MSIILTGQNKFLYGKIIELFQLVVWFILFYVCRNSCGSVIYILFNIPARFSALSVASQLHNLANLEVYFFPWSLRHQCVN